MRLHSFHVSHLVCGGGYVSEGFYVIFHPFKSTFLPFISHPSIFIHHLKSGLSEEDRTTCENCGNHTEGRRCESCVSGYFRPPDHVATAPCVKLWFWVVVVAVFWSSCVGCGCCGCYVVYMVLWCGRYGDGMGLFCCGRVCGCFVVILVVVDVLSWCVK